MHIVEGMGSSRLIWNNNKNTTEIFRPRIKRISCDESYTTRKTYEYDQIKQIDE